MSFSVDFSGLDAFQRRLDELRKRVERLGDEKDVSLLHLFTPAFMHAQTPFSSFEEFVKAGGFSLDTLANTPSEKWEHHVTESTKFSSWEEMQRVAHIARIRRELGFEQD